MSPSTIAATLATWLLATTALYAQDSPQRPLPSLNTVVWNGPGTTLPALRGKAVVVMSYVTWCPKCNAWMPEVLDQLKAAIKDKPVVVLAISTETPTVPGPVYMARMKFFAPNILHGHDPTIDARFGFKSLNNFAVIDPEGKIVESAAAGRYFKRPDGKEFTVGVKAAEAAAGGKFELIDPAMSDNVKQVLWPLEMGRILPERQLARIRRLLTPEQREELEAALDRFVERQVTLIEELAEGEVPDRIQAYESAQELSVNFRRNERAADARKIVARLSKDRTFRKELAARLAYGKTLSLIARKPERREQLLRGFAKRYDETYFGKVAADSVQVTMDESASTEAEAVAE